MKMLVFAVTGYNLAETGRHIENAETFLTLMLSLKGRKWPSNAYFSDFQVKKLKYFKFQKNFLDVSIEDMV